MLEVSIHNLINNGYYGYILPLASVSTERLKPLHDYLHNLSGNLFVASFSTRPSKIFKNAEQRVAIIMGTKKHKPSDKMKVFTTKYNMWYSSERKSLFKQLKFSQMTETIDGFTGFPKISEEYGYSILSKMKAKLNYLDAYFSSQKTNNSIYYHRGLRYWAKVLAQPAEIIYATGERKTSDTYIQVNLKNDIPKNIILAILNTNLFYWYWLVWSDCRMLNKREIQYFPFDINMLTSSQYEKLITLGNTLMEDYIQNSKRFEIRHPSKGQMEYSEFYPKMSRNIIIEIDNILADYYGFTNEELDYIINYEIRFRLGEENSEEED